LCLDELRVDHQCTLEEADGLVLMFTRRPFRQRSPTSKNPVERTRMISRPRGLCGDQLKIERVF
jgi:hypothetical protein